LIAKATFVFRANRPNFAARAARAARAYWTIRAFWTAKPFLAQRTLVALLTTGAGWAFRAIWTFIAFIAFCATSSISYCCRNVLSFGIVIASDNRNETASNGEQQQASDHGQEHRFRRTGFHAEFTNSEIFMIEVYWHKRFDASGYPQ
jgi:uncharacterized membrane protein